MLNLIFLRVSANALSNPGMIIVVLILLSPFFIYGYSLTNKLAEILKTDYPKLFMEYEDELTGLKRDLKVVLFASEIRNLDDKRVQDIRKKNIDNDWCNDSVHHSYHILDGKIPTF